MDAQREACEAFIQSQKHEGWAADPAMYDDGGISGATMDRPALQRLLADIAIGRIDVVVVYKVDRLTRTLSDFARIVEILDKNQVSFVSVTQQFNTTTSMGRLTLNVLLSFAQFEREVTGERIRDKIAASKKKGMWMGGTVPLGYDARDRKLVVNESEAETVRHIFRRYTELKSVRVLKTTLDAAGIVSKKRVLTDGRVVGGNRLARGALYLMLQNRLYRGEIVHKDKAYPGQHQAIIEQDLWDAVRVILKGNRVAREEGATTKQPSLLTGLLLDAQGERMTPTHAVKAGKRYRYYVSQQLITGGDTTKSRGQRLPAEEIEALVAGHLASWLQDPGSLAEAIGGDNKTAAEQQSHTEQAVILADAIHSENVGQIRARLIAVLSAIQVHLDRVEIRIDRCRFLSALGHDVLNEQHPVPPVGGGTITLTVPVRLRRTGIEMKLVLEDVRSIGKPKPSLLKLLAGAFAIKERALNNPSQTIRDIAIAEGVSDSYASRVLRLTYLAPDIVTAILDGRQPSGLSARRLLSRSRLPLDWAEQRQVLGFI